MKIKPELLIFTRKEIFIILTLLILVGLFSFTIGLKLGKNLVGTKTSSVELPPLAAGKPLPIPVEEPHEDEDTLQEKPHVKPEQIAEDHADSELYKELDKEKLSLGKKLPMDVPKEKKSEIQNVRYTLQVGSHRTVTEAAEQVSILKRSDFDAFYLEAKVQGKGTWYRVGVGLFPSKELAEQTALRLKKSKPLPSYIVQRINE